MLMTNASSIQTEIGIRRECIQELKRPSSLGSMKSMPKEVFTGRIGLTVLAVVCVWVCVCVYVSPGVGEGVGYYIYTEGPSVVTLQSMSW